MYLTNSQRSLKLLGHLCSNPQNIVPYLRFFMSAQSPLELELPWWSLSAIRELEKHLNPKHRVFEWGSGGSSVFLAKRCKELTTIEQDQHWFDQVEKIINDNQIKNSRLLRREINLENEKAFLSSPYAKSLKSTYDIIIIDGEDHFGPESSWFDYRRRLLALPLSSRKYEIQKRGDSRKHWSMQERRYLNGLSLLLSDFKCQAILRG